MNKWFSIMLMLGFAATNFAWAQDEEYEDEEFYEEEEETPAPKKKPKKKAAKDETPAGPSRIGLQAGFAGGNSLGDIPFVAAVYDMGTGLEIGLGLGIRRTDYTPNEGDDTSDPVQIIVIVPSVNYGLGKGLLDYGIGVSLGIASKDAGVDIFATPNFYASAELVKNVSIGLSAGIEIANIKSDGGADLNINFVSAGTITFYFL